MLDMVKNIVLLANRRGKLKIEAQINKERAMDLPTGTKLDN